jgi:hypothetical protein
LRTPITQVRRHIDDGMPEDTTRQRTFEFNLIERDSLGVETKVCTVSLSKR